MSIDPITALLEAGTAIVNKIWPDAESKQKRIAELQMLAASGDSEQLAAQVTLLGGQLEINKVEAAHPSLWVSGARPAILWVGALALFWSGVVHPMLIWVWAFADIAGTPPPALESASLTAVVTGLLGIGAMRSHDKAKGVDTKRHQ